MSVFQIKTQNPTYWQEGLSITDQDIEYLYELLIESSKPHTIEELALALIENRCRVEEEKLKAELEKGVLYQPKNSYEIGQQVVFPTHDLSLGTVVGIRAGHNPQYGDFTVIQVRFDEEDTTREFAAELSHPHKLNQNNGDELVAQQFPSPSELYTQYGQSVAEKLLARLSASDELGFVRFGDEWFLKELLAEVHIGHLNIAEALLDINDEALSTEELLKEIDLPDDVEPSLKTFSLNYALQQDERFDDVGTDEQVLWYLHRLEPPEVTHPPRRLQVSIKPYDRSWLDEQLLHIEREIDDEATPPELFGPNWLTKPASAVTFTLNYPHRRVGTIPLTPKIRSLFPKGSRQHTRITFKDARSGEQFAGWIAHEHGYVFGLDQWYERYELPVGAYIRVEQTTDPMVFVVDYEHRRPKREWVRVARAENGRLVFTMQKRVIGCQYDELMLVGEDQPTQVDALWVKVEETGKELVEVIVEIFPELAKLSPQGTVHAKTLYSAVNIEKRCPPGPIFAELARQPCFIDVDNGYWTFDESQPII